MARIVTVVLILTMIACVHAAPGQREVGNATYSVNASSDSIGVGLVSGGTFGAGSFSIGHGGQSAGSGHGGHGGNYGTNSYGGPGGDTGHISYG